MITTRPSLNPRSASPIEGPCKEKGPSAMGLDAFPSCFTSLLIVKTCRDRIFATVDVCWFASVRFSCQVPATNSTSTLPATNVEAGIDSMSSPPGNNGRSSLGAAAALPPVPLAVKISPVLLNRRLAVPGPDKRNSSPSIPRS